MASVSKIRLGSFNRLLFKNFVSKPTVFRNQPKLCFHHSSLLYVVGQEIKMPSLSPTMTEGTIVKWLKKEGDAVAPGDVLCEIQTDKAVMSFEIEEEGILARIVMPDDSKDVKVGTMIALLVAEGEDWKSVESPSQSGSAAPPSSSSAAPTPVMSGGSVPGMEVNMPSLSPTMTEGTIVRWLKKEGDTVAPGDVLCEIQTDKAVMSFEIEEEGVLAKILVPEDTKDVKVGTLIALLVNEGEDWKDVAIPGTSSGEKPSAARGAPVASAASPSASEKSSTSHHDMKMGPAVRTLLEAYELNASEVKGSGPHGLLTKGDVLQVIKQRGLSVKTPKPVPLPSQTKATAATAQKPTPSVSLQLKPLDGYSDIELSGMRKTIAKRLTESKTQIPHSYGVVECQVDKILSMRKQLKAEGIAVSVNDFVIKAVAVALQQVPQVNAVFNNDVLSIGNSVDISVATPNGLITPIVKDADRLGLQQISNAVKELAGKAKEGKLQPHEFIGGTFTISNLGMFGINEFSAIINPPQVGILAVGGGRPDVDEDGKLRTLMTATLSYDRRAIDEVTAADFLESVRKNLENPNMMIIGGVASRAEAEERQALGLC